MTYHSIRAGVIGWPIDHSLSPKLHGFWLKQLGIEGTYQAISVEPEALDTTLTKLVENGFVGWNVTVPHKETVMAYMDSISKQARKIGAVNTVVVDKQGQRHGSNTDGFGFLENLKQGYPEFDPAGGSAVILGAGGAARAIVVALIDAGAPSVILANRTRERAEKMGKDIEGPLSVVDWENREQALENATLLVNTTTLGMAGKPPLDLSLDALPQDALVNDIVYAPLETDLLKKAARRGNPTVDGIGMLLHQARPGFAAWFGVEPEVTDDLRGHVLSGLGT